MQVVLSFNLEIIAKSQRVWSNNLDKLIVDEIIPLTFQDKITIITNYINTFNTIVILWRSIHCVTLVIGTMSNKSYSCHHTLATVRWYLSLSLRFCHLFSHSWKLCSLRQEITSGQNPRPSTRCASWWGKLIFAASCDRWKRPENKTMCVF